MERPRLTRSTVSALKRWPRSSRTRGPGRLVHPRFCSTSIVLLVPAPTSTSRWRRSPTSDPRPSTSLPRRRDDVAASFSQSARSGRTVSCLSVHAVDLPVFSLAQLRGAVAAIAEAPQLAFARARGAVSLTATTLRSRQRASSTLKSSPGCHGPIARAALVRPYRARAGHDVHLLALPPVAAHRLVTRAPRCERVRPRPWSVLPLQSPADPRSLAVRAANGRHRTERSGKGPLARRHRRHTIHGHARSAHRRPAAGSSDGRLPDRVHVQGAASGRIVRRAVREPVHARSAQLAGVVSQRQGQGVDARLVRPALLADRRRSPDLRRMCRRTGRAHGERDRRAQAGAGAFSGVRTRGQGARRGGQAVRC